MAEKNFVEDGIKLQNKVDGLPQTKKIVDNEIY